MSIKTYSFYCNFCGYKRTTNGNDIQDLVPVKQSPIPGGVPYLDPVTKKTVIPKSFAKPKKFKCPKCGRVITPRKVNTTNDTTDEKNLFT